jgi:hypothetical protein
LKYVESGKQKEVLKNQRGMGWVRTPEEVGRSWMMSVGGVQEEGRHPLNKESVSGINPRHDVQTLIDSQPTPRKGQIAVGVGE